MGGPPAVAPNPKADKRKNKKEILLLELFMEQSF